MFKNYLIVAIRNLRRHKGYAFINVAGLAIGMAGCLLMTLFVLNELSYDRYHENANRLYRLAAQADDASYENGIAKVTDPWGPAAVEQVPEVEAMTRFVIFGRTLVSRGETRLYETSGLFADPTVFDLFSWPLLDGDPATALTEPNTVVLTETMAARYFPDEDPVGQTLEFDNGTPYRVTGVMEDIPLNSHFTFDFLVSLDTHTHPDRGDWVRWNQFYTYILLRPDADPDAVATNFDAVLDQYLEPENAASTFPLLQPVTRIHLHSKLFRELSANGDATYVAIFGAIAFFLLLIAGINFVNLSTARAAQRAGEVGVRKAVGANRGVLVTQFLGESMVLSLLAVVAAVVLVEIVLPGFNTLAQQNLTLDLRQPATLVGVGAIALGVGLAAGVYPALFLSAFKPVQVLKGHRHAPGGTGLRKGLVVFQFAVSAFLITATSVVYNQVSFIQNRNLGFNQDQVMTIYAQENDTAQQAETIKQRLSQHPGVQIVSASANHPGGSDYGIPYVAPGLTEDERPSMRMLVIDEDFLDTYDMEIVAGRGFSREFVTDSAAYLVNETAARQLGWEDVLGEHLAMPALGREPGPIVGVVKDFHFRSLHDPIAPLMFFMEGSWASRFSVKVGTQNLDETLAFIEDTWAEFEPDHPMVYSFMDDQFDQLHQSETRMGQIVGRFAGLAILIACLGLFGLAAFSAEQRTKELGIRKVLGASTAHLVGLFASDFLKLVGLAFVLSLPLAYIALSRWLDGFAYAVELGPGVFVVAALVTLVITLATVSYQSIKAARANPVESLRYE